MHRATLLLLFIFYRYLRSATVASSDQHGTTRWEAGCLTVLHQHYTAVIGCSTQLCPRNRKTARAPLTDNACFSSTLTCGSSAACDDPAQPFNGRCFGSCETRTSPCDGDTRVLRNTFGLPQETIGKLLCYAKLLEQRNQYINLISRKDIQNVWSMHIKPCIALLHFAIVHRASSYPIEMFRDTATGQSMANAAPFRLKEALGGIFRDVTHQRATTVLDIGTGGGLPGLILAMCCPNAKFTLVDSRKRKVQQLREMMELLNVTNVQLEDMRIESLASLHNSYDIIVGRAVAPLHEFIRLAAPFVDTRSSNAFGGIIYMCGGDILEKLLLASIDPNACTIQRIAGLYPNLKSDKIILRIPSTRLGTTL